MLYEVITVSGYAHSKIFEQAIKNGTLKTQTCSNYEQGLRMLLHSRMDILLGNESVIYSLIKSHPEWKGKLDFTPNFSSQHAYRIGISKKSPLVELLPDIRITSYNVCYTKLLRCSQQHATEQD